MKRIAIILLVSLVALGSGTAFADGRHHRGGGYHHGGHGGDWIPPLIGGIIIGGVIGGAIASQPPVYYPPPAYYPPPLRCWMERRQVTDVYGRQGIMHVQVCQQY